MWNFGQPKKTEGLLRQYAFWPGPGIMRSGRLGKYLASLMKGANLPNCRTGLCMLYHIHNHGNRRAKPVILAYPVLGQRVNGITTRWQKSRVKFLHLCVIVGRERTNCENTSEFSDQSSLSTKRLKISAFWLSSRGIHWVSIWKSLVKHNWNRSIATDCRGGFGLPNNAIQDAFSLSVKTLTFLWRRN